MRCRYGCSTPSPTRPGWPSPAITPRSHEAARSVDVTLAAGGHLCGYGHRLRRLLAAGHRVRHRGRQRAQQQANRALLRNAMAAGGLAVYSGEWWHFDGPGALTPRPILDVPVD